MRAALIAVAGCSFGGTTPAPPPDAPAGEPTAAAVRLTVRERGAPVAGDTAYFHDAGGALVATIVTDAHGVAWAEVGAGGSVTLHRARDREPPSGVDDFLTFAAVEPGDALELELAPADRVERTLVSVTIPPDDEALSYELHTSCGGPFGVLPSVATPVALGNCDGAADVLVVADDGSGALAAALYAPAVPVAPGGAIEVAGAYQPLATSAYRYSGVRDGVDSVATYAALVGSHGRVFGRSDSAPVAGGLAVVELAMPAVAGATMLVATAEHPAPDAPGLQQVYDRVAPGDYAIDLAAIALPPYTSRGALDAATGRVTWTEAAGGAPADLVRTRVRAFRSDSPEGRAWRWRMVAPRAGAAHPALPPIEGFDFGFAPGDVVTVDELTTARIPGGYAAVRAHGFDDLIGFDHGRVVVQTLHEPEL